MTREQIFEQIRKKRSFLCVGLDTDPLKMPAFLAEKEDGVYIFNKEIVDATAEYAIAYKPNLAFYEARGLKGWQDLEKTVQYIKENYPEIFVIADAKRGDIGNTSKQYAKAFFENLPFDAITVAPYMGSDSVQPFLLDGKWVILLALTSNKGASDFQFLEAEGDQIFEKVLKTSSEWASPEQMMYVVGATKSDLFDLIRAKVPDHFLLVPGIGAQGGSLQEVAQNGMNDHCGLIVNASRSVIFASNGEDFAEKAAAEAKNLKDQMHILLTDKGL